MAFAYSLFVTTLFPFLAVIHFRLWYIVSGNEDAPAEKEAVNYSKFMTWRCSIGGHNYLRHNQGMQAPCISYNLLSVLTAMLQLIFRFSDLFFFN